MAKKEKKNGRQQGGNGGRSGDIGKHIVDSDAGRARKRKQAQARENARMQERERGTFHTRTNSERSNDLQTALSGVCGSYAYPGGNQPSIHFTVAREARQDGPINVIYLESIQEGHELAGRAFDPTVYTPCHYVVLYGENFSSRLKNKIQKNTQELVCRYLARESSCGFVEDVTGDDLVEQASQNMADLVAGKPGLYYRKASSGEGEVVLEVFIGKKPSVRIVESTVPNLVASRAFIPVHLLERQTIEQVTDEDTYAFQFALFVFLRTELSELLTTSTQGHKSMGVKESAELERRKAAQIAKATEEAKDATKLHIMRAQSISVIAAASGAIGYADMSNLSGDLIVLFAKNGADHVAQVAYISEKHMLRLVGVDVGTRVYGGQILNGHVDRLDHGADKLSADDVKALNTLIGYIRDRFAEHHVRIPARKKANLARVA